MDVNTSLKGEYTFDYFLEEGVKDFKYYFQNNTNDLGYISEQITLKELDNYRNKKFLSFNRIVTKYHRYRLLCDYVKHDLSDSYFSFIELDKTVKSPPVLGRSVLPTAPANNVSQGIQYIASASFVTTRTIVNNF